MSEFLKVFLLGIVEGITEWLPISSTGHMILVEEFIQLNVSADFMEMFRVVIQLGAILAVVLLYFPKLWPLVRLCGDMPYGDGLAQDFHLLPQTSRFYHNPFQIVRQQHFL